MTEKMLGFVVIGFEFQDPLEILADHIFWAVPGGTGRKMRVRWKASGITQGTLKNCLNGITCSNHT
jgi:hypothetical protein